MKINPQNMATHANLVVYSSGQGEIIILMFFVTISFIGKSIFLV